MKIPPSKTTNDMDMRPKYKWPSNSSPTSKPVHWFGSINDRNVSNKLFPFSFIIYTRVYLFRLSFLQANWSIELPALTPSAKMKKDTVKLISAEGFEFVIDKKAAIVSQTIRNMLTSPGQSPFFQFRLGIFWGSFRFNSIIAVVGAEMWFIWLERLSISICCLMAIG